jgi:glycosyltransferase involved in cell wall biosynthesis
MQLLSHRTVLLSSEDARNDCETFYPRSKSRTAVARFAVQPALQPGENDPRVTMDLGLPMRFLYLPNQYWVHKNHIRIIDALGVLRDRGTSAVVASSGNPKDPIHAEHYARLQSMVRDRQLTENFLFLGNVTKREVAVLMRSAIAVLNPSLSEGWSTTVEEAKSLGARLVLSDIRVHREQTAQQAEYFDPYDSEATAITLERVWRQNTAPPTLEHQQEAAQESLNRIREFASQLSLACDQAVERFNR